MDLVLYSAFGILVLGAMFMMGLVILSLFEEWWSQL